MEVIPSGIAPGQGDMRAARSSLRNLYWTFRQMVCYIFFPLILPLLWDVVLSDVFLQLAFHTLSGCHIRAGDLIGSGTLSGEMHPSYFVFASPPFLTSTSFSLHHFRRVYNDSLTGLILPLLTHWAA